MQTEPLLIKDNHVNFLPILRICRSHYIWSGAGPFWRLYDGLTHDQPKTLVTWMHISKTSGPQGLLEAACKDFICSRAEVTMMHVRNYDIDLIAKLDFLCQHLPEDLQVEGFWAV